MKGRKGKIPPMMKGKMAKPFGATKEDVPAGEPTDMKEEMPPVQGFKARMRLDRPGRKRGGRVGADMAPLSSAAKGC